MPDAAVSCGNSPSTVARDSAFAVEVDEEKWSPGLDGHGNQRELARIEVGLVLGAGRGAQRAVEVVGPGVIVAL